MKDTCILLRSCKKVNRSYNTRLPRCIVQDQCLWRQGRLDRYRVVAAVAVEPIDCKALLVLVSRHALIPIQLPGLTRSVVVSSQATKFCDTSSAFGTQRGAGGGVGPPIDMDMDWDNALDTLEYDAFFLAALPP